VLARFTAIEAVDRKGLESYLASHSPDKRFQELLERLARNGAADAVAEMVRETIRRLPENAEGLSNKQFWGIVDRLQELCTGKPYFNSRQTSVAIRKFGSPRPTGPGAEAIEEDQPASEVQSEQLPRVVFDPRGFAPHAPGLVQLDSGQPVTFGYDIADATGRSFGLLLTTVVGVGTGKVVFRPTVYPLASDGVSPESIDNAILFFTQYSGPTHECAVGRFGEVIQNLPAPMVAIAFAGLSWTSWLAQNNVAGGSANLLTNGALSLARGALGGAIQFHLQRDLSEFDLLLLLSATGFGEPHQCFFVPVGKLLVACFWDTANPVTYILQLVDPQIGEGIFQKIANRYRFHLNDVAVDPLPNHHMDLIVFLCKVMVSDTLALSEHSPLMTF
jgi:hypothetical protein